MSNYKSGYSEARSPAYAQGFADGAADNERQADGKDPLGPNPPDPAYPVMYMKGYQAARG